MQGDHYMKTLKDFFRKETVFCVSFLLALISAAAVRPDSDYLTYPDYRTLALGLPDSCPAVLFYDHCGRFPVAGSIFSFRRDVIKESQQSAEPVCAYGAFVFLFQYDHYK